jgi:hypothetical protein
VFDPLSAAENIASLPIERLLDPEKAARMILFKSLDDKQPGLEEILDRIVDATIHARHRDNYYNEIQRAVNNVVVNKLILLAANTSNTPQVRAFARNELIKIKKWINQNLNSSDSNYFAHFNFLMDQIDFYLNNPDRFISIPVGPVPAGAPIGSY